MSHIFISYSKKNKDYARRLADYLLEHGFDVWIDDRIDYGENWLREIVKAVRNCAACVVLMTPESEVSRWVELEVAWAHKWNKPMFPVLRAGENWPIFELTQYVNALNGALPDARFLDELRQVTSPKRVHGQNITPQAEPERDPQPLDLAQPPAHVEPDIFAVIDEFFQLCDDGHWLQAQRLLEHIAASRQTPAWFDVQHYRQEVGAAIERELAEQRRGERENAAEQRQREWENAAEREYAIIRRLAQREKPERVWAALQGFWRVYQGYAPDHLKDHVIPTKQLLNIMLNPAVPPDQRAEAGRQLAKIGDPRPGVGLLPNGAPDIAWSATIKAGKFQMGGDSKAYKAWDGAQVDLNYPFWIARYPVTYAQYAAFVAAGGYQDQTYWTQVGWEWKKAKTEPEDGWNDPQWHISNHPVIGVMWYEAYAFTCWLDEHRRAGQLSLPAGVPKNYVLRLPTEAEWEKAARYPDGRQFPWGNEYVTGYANVDEVNSQAGPHDLRRTTAVGIYPQGANPATGAYDVSGNVLEWCLSRWNNDYRFPEENDPDGDAARVLRGGSWDGGMGGARCASRDWLDPYNRHYLIGFRVVCASPL